MITNNFSSGVGPNPLTTRNPTELGLSQLGSQILLAAENSAYGFLQLGIEKVALVAAEEEIQRSKRYLNGLSVSAGHQLDQMVTDYFNELKSVITSRVPDEKIPPHLAPMVGLYRKMGPSLEKSTRFVLFRLFELVLEDLIDNDAFESDHALFEAVLSAIFQRMLEPLRRIDPADPMSAEKECREFVTLYLSQIYQEIPSGTVVKQALRTLALFNQILGQVGWGVQGASEAAFQALLPLFKVVRGVKAYAKQVEEQKPSKPSLKECAILVRKIAQKPLKKVENSSLHALFSEMITYLLEKEGPLVQKIFTSAPILLREIIPLIQESVRSNEGKIFRQDPLLREVSERVFSQMVVTLLINKLGYESANTILPRLQKTTLPSKGAKILLLLWDNMVHYRDKLQLQVHAARKKICQIPGCKIEVLERFTKGCIEKLFTKITTKQENDTVVPSLIAAALELKNSESNQSHIKAVSESLLFLILAEQIQKSKGVTFDEKVASLLSSYLKKAKTVLLVLEQAKTEEEKKEVFTQFCRMWIDDLKKHQHIGALLEHIEDTEIEKIVEKFLPVYNGVGPILEAKSVYKGQECVNATIRKALKKIFPLLHKINSENVLIQDGLTLGLNGSISLLDQALGASQKSGNLEDSFVRQLVDYPLEAHFYQSPKLYTDPYLYPHLLERVLKNFNEYKAKGLSPEEKKYLQDIPAAAHVLTNKLLAAVFPRGVDQLSILFPLKDKYKLWAVIRQKLQAEIVEQLTALSTVEGRKRLLVQNLVEIFGASIPPDEIRAMTASELDVTAEKLIVDFAGKEVAARFPQTGLLSYLLAIFKWLLTLYAKYKARNSFAVVKEFIEKDDASLFMQKCALDLFDFEIPNEKPKTRETYKEFIASTNLFYYPMRTFTARFVPESLELDGIAILQKVALKGIRK